MKNQSGTTTFGERLLLVITGLAAVIAACALLLMAFFGIDGQASPSEMIGMSAFICACCVGVWGAVRTLLYLFAPDTSDTPMLQLSQKIAFLPIGLAVLLCGVVLALARSRA